VLTNIPKRVNRASVVTCRGGEEGVFRNVEVKVM